MWPDCGICRHTHYDSVMDCCIVRDFYKLHHLHVLSITGMLHLFIFKVVDGAIYKIPLTLLHFCTTRIHSTPSTTHWQSLIEMHFKRFVSDNRSSNMLVAIDTRMEHLAGQCPVPPFHGGSSIMCFIGSLKVQKVCRADEALSTSLMVHVQVTSR